MTMHDLEVSLLDVYREFHLARLPPRDLQPAPKIAISVHSPKPDLSGLLDSLHLTQHVLEMFRRTLPDGSHRHLLDRLANRLTKIASEARTLGHP